MAGWVGFDLDGTLAEYDGWRGATHIGAPVAPMVELAKEYLRQGTEVRIFTARSGDPAAEAAIVAWCEEHLGQRLVVTNTKDFECLRIFDDRAVQVETNTGRIEWKEVSELASQEMEGWSDRLWKITEELLRLRRPDVADKVLRVASEIDNALQKCEDAVALGGKE